MALSSNDILTNAVGSSGAALPAVEIFSLGSVSGATTAAFAPPSSLITNQWTSGAGTRTANEAQLYPLAGLVQTMTLKRIRYRSSTDAGNIDVGIYYSDDAVTFTRVWSSGALLMSGVTTVSTGGPAPIREIVMASPVTLVPQTGRNWYWASGFSNATASVGQFDSSAYTKAASVPLPQTLTGMTYGLYAPCALLALV